MKPSWNWIVHWEQIWPCHSLSPRVVAADVSCHVRLCGSGFRRSELPRRRRDRQLRTDWRWLDDGDGPAHRPFGNAAGQLCRTCQLSHSFAAFALQKSFLDLSARAFAPWPCLFPVWLVAKPSWHFSVFLFFLCVGMHVFVCVRERSGKPVGKVSQDEDAGKGNIWLFLFDH